MLMAALASCGGDGKPNDPLVDPVSLVTAALPGVDLGDDYRETIQAKGGVAPYTYSITAGEPPLGIELARAGVISGVAAAPGRATFTVQATDSRGESASGELSIYVRPDPLEIGALTLLMAREDMPYEQTLTVRGGLEPHIWSMVQGNLPAGLALSTEGTISGTPDEFGSFDFTVRVTDAENITADRSLHLTVISANPMITTTTIEKARLGVPYQEQLEAEGGSPPYEWTIASGTVPDGLNLASNGTLAGTPLVSGIYTLTVVARDARSRVDMRDVVLRVIAPLVISTTQLNQAIHDRPYSFSLTAEGGEEPYTWTITAGSLPNGLVFNNGTISGMTPSVGDYPLTVRLRDNEAFTQAAQFTLRVSDRFTFDSEAPMVFPATCTGTVVAFTPADLVIADSMQIADLDVQISTTFIDAGKLKIMLESPWGQQTTLCGHDNRNMCETAQLNLEYDDDGASANRPDAPLSSFDGYNPQGRWRLIVLVVDPICGETGTVNSFRLTIQDDRDPTEYIAVRGFTMNNLVHYPWVRVDDENYTGDGVDHHELFLTAKLYYVGPNGFREGGLGDDIEDPLPLTWSWVGEEILGTVLSIDGYVHAGMTTGKRQIIASGGASTVTLDLLVSPPDWNSGR
jgi:subtilisin-like proprotein convertase family protein